MPFDLQDIEQLAHAIAHVNGHPSAKDYAKSVSAAWHELFVAEPKAAEPDAPQGDADTNVPQP
jgi:hypothetical protein